MTVIATDGKSLVADRQITEGNLKFESTKLCAMSNGALVGVAGDAADFQKVWDWYEQHLEDPDVAFPEDISEETEALVLYPHGSITVIDHNGAEIDVERRFHAIGSGGAIALGVLALGLDARSAVATAMKLDIYSGMGIDEARIPATGQDPELI